MQQDNQTNPPAAELKAPEDRLLLAMPMFEQGQRYSIDALMEHLQQHWGYTLDKPEHDNTDQATVFSINGCTCIVAFIAAAIPAEDIEHCAQFAYSWQTVLEDIGTVDGHAIVSVGAGDMDIVDRHLLFARILYSMMATPPSCVGIYQGNQTLLISRERYLGFYQEIQQADIAALIPFWVYIGWQVNEHGSSIYTYGLNDFGKQELEVVNSALELDELYPFLLNVCAYLIQADVELQDGETLGYSADQKIDIVASAGVFLEGETLKLMM